ncbi:MAG: hypothetical protein ACREV5_16600 [Steroidobacter sp.]
MTDSHGLLAEGDRVRALKRPGFPLGSVLRLLNSGFVLVRWDSGVLETAHSAELVKVEPDAHRS